DIELPDGSGLELMRDLQHRGIPGIALSGHGSEDDVRQSRAAGFAVHLVKPVLADVLDEAICLAASPVPDADDPDPAQSDPDPVCDGPGPGVSPLRAGPQARHKPARPRAITRPLRDQPRM